MSKGAALTITMRWTDRLIGFISVLILARLLVPEDFGIIVMASLVIGLTDVLLDLGVHIALIQNPSPTPAHYNTAWTLRLIQALLATILVCAIAPWAAVFFAEPQITLVIQVLALSFLISGLENIGIVNFQKEMRFTDDFRFTFAKRIAGFIATITAAFWLQSFWALVIGTLVGRSSGLILSYLMHPMRPRLSLVQFKEIFAISQWVLVRNVGIYLDQSLHTMLVGRRDSTHTTGAYSLANEISTLPTTELLAPINRVLFPAFVQVKHNTNELKRLFLLAQGVQALVGIPAGIGLALVAQEAIPILLGESWLSAIPFVEIIALVGVVTALLSSGVYVCLTLGRVRLIAAYTWSQVCLFGLLTIVMLPQAEALEIAWLRLTVAVLGVGILAWILIDTLDGLKLWELLDAVYRPLLAAIFMALCVSWAGIWVDGAMGWLLIAKISIGIVSYTTTVALLWWAVGHPAGAEAYMVEQWQRLYNRLFRNPS